MEFRFIVNVSYNRFVFDDDCAALAFACVAKRKAEDEDIRVEIYIETVKVENGVEEKKDGEES